MIRLTKNQIEKILPFYTRQTPLELQFTLELQYAYHGKDCFNNTCDTPVYGDDGENPNILLITANSPFKSIWMHLSGNAEYEKSDKKLYKFILGQLDLLNDDIMRIELSLYSPGWVPKLEKMLESYVKDKWLRYNYRLNKQAFSQNINWRENIPAGFEMRFSADSSDKHDDGQFEKFGFTLFKNDTKISECNTVYFEKESHDSKIARIVEIGVGTEEEYRRQGFAFLTCAAFIEYCLSNNLEPNWGCYHFNPESQALAKKLGFEEISQRNILILEK